MLISLTSLLSGPGVLHGGTPDAADAEQPPAPVVWPAPEGGEEATITWPGIETLPGGAGGDLPWPGPDGEDVLIVLPGEPDPTSGDGGDDTQPGGGDEDTQPRGGGEDTQPGGGDVFPEPDLTPAPDDAVGARISAAGITIIGRTIDTGARISAAGLTVIQRSS